MRKLILVAVLIVGGGVGVALGQTGVVRIGWRQSVRTTWIPAATHPCQQWGLLGPAQPFFDPARGVPYMVYTCGDGSVAVVELALTVSWEDSFR